MIALTVTCLEVSHVQRGRESFVAPGVHTDVCLQDNATTAGWKHLFINSGAALLDTS